MGCSPRDRKESGKTERLTRTYLHLRPDTIKLLGKKVGHSDINNNTFFFFLFFTFHYSTLPREMIILKNDKMKSN